MNGRGIISYKKILFIAVSKIIYTFTDQTLQNRKVWSVKLYNSWMEMFQKIVNKFYKIASFNSMILTIFDVRKF
jgi:hypothetical protein